MSIVLEFKKMASGGKGAFTSAEPLKLCQIIDEVYKDDNNVCVHLAT